MNLPITASCLNGQLLAWVSQCSVFSGDIWCWFSRSGYAHIRTSGEAWVVGIRYESHLSRERFDSSSSQTTIMYSCMYVIENGWRFPIFRKGRLQFSNSPAPQIRLQDGDRWGEWGPPARAAYSLVLVWVRCRISSIREQVTGNTAKSARPIRTRTWMCM